MKRSYFINLILVVMLFTGCTTYSFASLADPPHWAELPDYSTENFAVSPTNIKLSLGYRGNDDFDFLIEDGTLEGHTWDVSGRFSIVNIAGDPDNLKDDGLSLVQDWTDTKIDAAGAETNSGRTAPAGKFGYFKLKVGENFYVVGDGGNWTIPPSVVSPPAGIGAGKNGQYIRAEWLETTTQVAVNFKINVIRDQARFEVTLLNRGNATQSVGLSMVCVPGFQYPGPYGADFLDAVSLPFIPGIGLLEYGRWFQKKDLPDNLFIYDSIEDPTVAINVGLGGQDAVKPDYFAVGDMVELAGWWRNDALTADELSIWIEPTLGNPTGTFKPDPIRRIGSGGLILGQARWEPYQMAWLSCWKQAALSVNNIGRKITTYIGSGGSSSSFTYKKGGKVVLDTAVLAVGSPEALKYNTVAVDTPDNIPDISPDTFTVKAYVVNLASEPGLFDLQNVDLSILLPTTSGLSLASTSKVTYNVGKIAFATESDPVSWNIIPSGDLVGTREFFVTAKDKKTGWTQTVKRSILIPATGKVKTVSGWQMMSIPFQFADNSFYYALNKAKGQVFANEWAPTSTTAGKYKTITNFESGKGYWVYLPKNEAGTLDIADDREIIGANNGTQSETIMVDLNPGWNMISNPYVYPIYLSKVNVFNKQTSDAYPWTQAVTNSLVGKTPYYYNSDKKAYETLTKADSQLLPWRAYWIQVKKPITIIFTPMSWPASSVTVPSN